MTTHLLEVVLATMFLSQRSMKGIIYCYMYLYVFFFRILKHKKTVSLVVVISALMIIAYYLDGAHQDVRNFTFLLYC